MLCSSWLSVLPVSLHFATEVTTRKPKATKGTPDPPEHAKAPQETPQDTPGAPQEAPKAPQGSPLSFILASFWHPGWVLGWVSHFSWFLLCFFAPFFTSMLAHVSIQKWIIFVI